MREIAVESPGGLDVLHLVQGPTPIPGPGEVLIRSAAASVNWGDVQKRQGIYPDPVTYPIVLGMEVSGVIDALGAGVPRRWKGRHVAALCGPALAGGYAEAVAVPLAYVIPVPEGLDPVVAAAFPLASLTAYHLLRSATSTGKGDVVLVHAAAGSVGLAVTQIARSLGATVIGTVGDPGKADVALHYGAARIVDRTSEDFVDVALSLTRGVGVDLVIDSLGGDILPRSFDALRTYGRLVNIGEAAGEPNFAVRKKLYERSTSMAGFELLQALPGSARWKAGVRFVLREILGGRLTIPVGQRRPLEQAAELHALLEGRSTYGKLVLDIGASAA